MGMGTNVGYKMSISKFMLREGTQILVTNYIYPLGFATCMNCNHTIIVSLYEANLRLPSTLL